MADKKASTVTTQTNPRGIPAAPFIDNVSDYVASRADVEPTLQRFQEMISKYQFMELNTQRRAAGLREKIPDIKKTLDVVRFLKMQKEVVKRYPLRARANLPTDTEEVYLWLGANVMLAYPIPEAETMLSEKLSAAEQSLANCDEDLEFLREQITTIEVATARVYNWDVVQRRKEKAEGKGDDDEEATDKRKSGG
ncbi:tubulin-binding prefolding complex subunit PAC10 [Aspergillus novofumigatus IBT 16806]|uniref:Prefoldin subunit 3 n=1 Tax=Aspergillus novofumigatus (strain IBT 16806) TaxID=1392255 RepID=A0A2I1CKK1_ASPN1|nr:putative prefoldin subunit 3 [Aspergillus novofumigatus IBT 16806]PKX98133.1 putative prefoldin subunit 3 [Aspergillus novofumigatus IBT 16806]